MKTGLRDWQIPRKPLLWLAAALIFTVPPMFGTLAIWVPLLFLATLAAKFWMEPRGYRFRSMIGKLLYAGLTIVGIFLTYGAVKGIARGVSIIVVLMSLKILESHTAREFQVMVLVAWILCLCGFFLSQDLAIALCLFVAFTLLLVALIQFHRGPSSPFWMPVRFGLKLLGQALPIVALLFLFFPRVQAGFRFQMAQSNLGASGFSGQLSPCSVASLANSSEVAFRAEFPHGKVPPPSALYWRGAVMRQGEGLEWRAPEAPASLSHFALRRPQGEAVHQLITIEPHGGRWLFALDWPAESPPGSTIAPGNYLWSYQPIRKSRRYEVKSFPEIPEKDLRSRERKTMLEVPASVSPAVRELVRSWLAANPDPSAVIKSALQFFRSSFRYSLSPGEYKKTDLDEFLFRRRVGFCEHYAASFATLMRLAGIPSRVVVGYLGGEYNEFGQFLLVRQSDAHAWCEVWLPEKGWQRVDPTSVVAPERINLGLSSFLEMRGTSGQAAGNNRGFVRNLTRRPIFNNVRLAWQSLNYAWDTRVLSFDNESQQSFLAEIGFSRADPVTLFIGMFLFVAGLISIYAGWMRWRTRVRGDQVKALYERFCEKLSRLGAPRQPWEGPVDYSSRAARLLPNESNRIRKISYHYILLRYSAEQTSFDLAVFSREVGDFANLRDCWPKLSG